LLNPSRHKYIIGCININDRPRAFVSMRMT